MRFRRFMICFLGWLIYSITTIFIILIIIIVGYFLYELAYTCYNNFLFYEWHKGFIPFEDIGPYVGGVFGTSAATIAAYFAYKAYTHQRNQNYRNEIEGRFFQLLQIYQSDLELLEKKTPNCFSSYLDVVRRLETVLYIYRNNHLPGWDDIMVLEITYLTFFYGVSDLNYYRMFRRNEYLTLNSIKELNKYLKDRGAKMSARSKELASFFRHLYELVCYIHHCKLDDRDKKKYIKIVCARMNEHQKYLFFLNSLFDKGREWELSPEIEGQQLITTYKLVHHISDEYDFIRGCKPITHYPIGDIER